MNRTMLVSCLSIAVLLSWWPAPAAASPDRNSVELALSGHESVPSKQDLLRLGPGVEQDLREIVRFPSRRALARTRAIAALRHFPSKAAASVLRGVIVSNRPAKRGLALLDLQQALTSYAVVAGPAALELIRPYLAHRSRDMRFAAAAAVRLTRSPAARRLLEQRQRVERSAMVRLQLERQITLLRRDRP